MSATTLNAYKTTFILDTRGTEAPVSELIENITKTIQSLEGEVKSLKELGTKDFAYVTKKSFTNAAYVQYMIDAPATFGAAIQEKLRLDKTVYRIFVQSA